MPLVGPTIKAREAADILRDAGWTNTENLAKMLATAMAEADLYTRSYHVNDDGTTDWGWLQLNDGGRTGQALEDFKEMAFDPVRAANHARSMYEARGFQPWVAYTSERYKARIPAAAYGIQNMLRADYGFPPA